MLYKGVGDMEAGYYESFCRLTNYIYNVRCVSDVLLTLLLSVLPELSNFEDEILLRRGECNSSTF